MYEVTKRMYLRGGSAKGGRIRQMVLVLVLVVVTLSAVHEIRQVSELAIPITI